MPSEVHRYTAKWNTPNNFYCQHIISSFTDICEVIFDNATSTCPSWIIYYTIVKLSFKFTHIIEPVHTWLHYIPTVYSYQLHKPYAKIKAGTPWLQRHNLNVSAWKWTISNGVAQLECLCCTVILQTTVQKETTRDSTKNFIIQLFIFHVICIPYIENYKEQRESNNVFSNQYKHHNINILNVTLTHHHIQILFSKWSSSSVVH